MVAKGLDFEDVTLVGVLGIDSLLFAQGFRAYENVFSLITQVVGRSGRARDPGFAIIQTTDPDNPVLNLAAAQDYDAFFEQEIAYRLHFPDQSYLGRYFKKHTGESPTEYRNTKK